MYLDLLGGLEASWLGHLARHSSWFFTVANLLHVLGATLVVGGIAVFDLKLIFGTRAEVPAVGRVALPLAAVGILIQLPTGFVLLAVEATKLGINPAFYVKMAFIALAILNLIVFHVRFGWTGGASLPEGARLNGVVSLASWLTVLLAGRMIAYL